MRAGWSECSALPLLRAQRLFCRVQGASGHLGPPEGVALSCGHLRLKCACPMTKHEPTHGRSTTSRISCVSTVRF